MSIVLIAAIDRMRAIGRGGAMPWHLPRDFQRFRELTVGYTVLMGRRTAESIGRALPQRRNLVLSRSGIAPFAGQIGVRSWDEAKAIDPNVRVIGGGAVYALALAEAQVLHLTHVDTTIADADAFFPAWDQSRFRREPVAEIAADMRHAHAFAFIDHVRIG
jgi:dihydrofolate reductase